MISTQRWTCLKVEKVFNWLAEMDGQQSKFRLFLYMFETKSDQNFQAFMSDPCEVRFFPDSWRGVGTATTEGVQLMVGGSPVWCKPELNPSRCLNTCNYTDTSLNGKGCQNMSKVSNRDDDDDLNFTSLLYLGATQRWTGFPCEEWRSARTETQSSDEEELCGGWFQNFPNFIEFAEVL